MDPISPGTSKPVPTDKQGMTAEQAIRAVPVDAAWKLRTEDKIGRVANVERFFTPANWTDLAGSRVERAAACHILV